MSNYDLNDEDVLFLEPNVPFLGETTTFKVDQVKATLIKQFIILANNGTAAWWFGKGFNCKLLSATQGGGWKRGKLRLRLEIELEPEPEPEPVNNDPNSLDSLRTELYPKP
jgi:hypothetical protein